MTMKVKWNWDVKPGRMNQRTDDLKVQTDYRVGMIVRRDES